MSLITANVTAQINNTDGVNFPKEMIAFGAICMILLAILGIAGNFISICALSKCKRLRRITTAFIVNLCVSDFFLSCCIFINSVFVYKAQHWNGGNRRCMFYNILIFFFAAATIFNVTTIALNRYVLIVHSRFYDSFFRVRNTVIIIGSIWTISLVTILLRYFKIWGEFGYDVNTGECTVIDRRGSTQIYNFILAYIVPLIVFILCYAKMFYVVRKTERNASNHESNIMEYVAKLNDKYWLQERKNKSDGTSYKHLRNGKERRLFKIIFVIFLSFILCFIPLTAMKMSRKEREYPSLYIICHLGVHLSHAINPIIYIVMSEEYRKAYKDLFRCSTKN